MRSSGCVESPVDPVRDTAPLRLTNSAEGESSAAYLPDGSVLFVSARKDAGVTAQLLDDLPIRSWDDYLGPRRTRYFVLEPEADGGFEPPHQVVEADTRHDDTGFDLSPDGSTLVVERRCSDEVLDLRSRLVAVDVDSGSERVLTPDDAAYESPAISHDGERLVCVRTEFPEDAALIPSLWIVPLDGDPEDGFDPAPDLDEVPGATSWTPDDAAIVLVADRLGHRPVHLVAADGGEVRQVTEQGSFAGVVVVGDGTTAVGLRSHLDAAPSPVVIDLGTGAVRALPSPGATPDLPGRLVDVTTTADDDVTIRSWLTMPEGADADHPAPLVVWVHGGPMGSWNDWSWRWNPWLLVERGYAVLLPDPAISTGYGLDFIRRGRRSWGHRPYTDVMAATDAAVARDDIDADRTALMGGSFGGYMANWVAGHTDRFRCIVTHASLWALDQFHGTTDFPPYWEFEWGNADTERDRSLEHSPHTFVEHITTPMLVIHGELDYRVPIGEGLRLWTDLQRHGVESKFLWFPDENHWVLKPQNARIWYETVFAWLDQHVLGEEWQHPELL